jgi:Zn-dependent protease with chaperone function
MGGENSSVGLARRLERLQLAGWLGQGGLVLASAGASLILRDRLGARLDWPLALLGGWALLVGALRATVDWRTHSLLARQANRKPDPRPLLRAWVSGAARLAMLVLAVLGIAAAILERTAPAFGALLAALALMLWLRRQRRRTLGGHELAPPDDRLLEAMEPIPAEQRPQACTVAGYDGLLLAVFALSNRTLLCASEPMLELLDEAQLRAMVYHERGHLRLGHLPRPGRRLWLRALLLAVALVAGVALALHLWSVPEALARLPVILLWLWVAKMLLGPLLLARSRRRERDAHAWALDNGADPDTYAAALTKLNDAMGHGRGRSPLWALLLFNSHPTLDETLEQIDRHRRREPGRQGATT